MRVGLPLFPVRKSFGEPKHAVMRRDRARPRPWGKTEGLDLQAYIFQHVIAIGEADFFAYL
jgi:hypothetical protein